MTGRLEGWLKCWRLWRLCILLAFQIGHGNLSGKQEPPSRWHVSLGLLSEKLAWLMKYYKKGGFSWVPVCFFFFLAPVCFLCQEKEESNNHLFLHCRITDVWWQLFLALAETQWMMQRITKDLLWCWNNTKTKNTQKKWWRMAPVCIRWTVWKERNNRCFENRTSSITIQRIKLNCFLSF